MTTNDREVIAQEGRSLIAVLTTLAIATPAHEQEASVLLQLAAAFRARVSEVFDPIVQAAFRTHQIALQQRAAVLQPVEAAERQLRGRLGEYRQALEVRRQQERQAAERARQEAEAQERERQAEELRRREREAEDRRLEEAARAEAAGDHGRAARLLEQPVLVPVPPPMPVFTPPPPAEPERIDGLTYKQDWSVEITDPMAIPREYLTIDEAAIQRVVRAMRGNITIPGVRIVARQVPIRRGR
jgi:hypothetical protein